MNWMQWVVVAASFAVWMLTCVALDRADVAREWCMTAGSLHAIGFLTALQKAGEEGER